MVRAGSSLAFKEYDRDVDWWSGVYLVCADRSIVVVCTHGVRVVRVRFPAVRLRGRMREYMRRVLKQCGAHLREIVYGGIDGIITTFAVVSGFTGAHFNAETTMSLSIGVVLLFGFANLFADGVSMGLGNFLSLRSAQKLYHSLKEKEREGILRNERERADETVRLLREQKFSQEDAETLVSIFRRNSEYWLSFLMRRKLHLPDTEDENTVLKSFAVFCAFLFFGAIPILPFLFVADPSQAFLFSVVGVGVALFSLALLRWAVIKENIVHALFEVLLIGGLAGSVAFVVGSFFAV